MKMRSQILHILEYCNADFFLEMLAVNRRFSLPLSYSTLLGK